MLRLFIMSPQQIKNCRAILLDPLHQMWHPRLIATKPIRMLAEQARNAILFVSNIIVSASDRVSKLSQRRCHDRLIKHNKTVTPKSLLNTHLYTQDHHLTLNIFYEATSFGYHTHKGHKNMRWLRSVPLSEHNISVAMMLLYTRTYNIIFKCLLVF